MSDALAALADDIYGSEIVSCGTNPTRTVTLLTLFDLLHSTHDIHQQYQFPVPDVAVATLHLLVSQSLIGFWRGVKISIDDFEFYPRKRMNRSPFVFPVKYLHPERLPPSLASTTATLSMSHQSVICDENAETRPVYFLPPHPFVETVFCYFFEGTPKESSFTNYPREAKLYRISEFSQNELLYYLSQQPNQIFPSEIVRYIAAEVFLALEHFHHSAKRNFGCLEPEFLCCTCEGHIKMLIPSKQLLPFPPAPEPAHCFCGVPDYLSPEVLKAEKAPLGAADWWALGCLVYELAEGLPPFYSKDNHVNEQYERILFAPLKFSDKQDPAIVSFCTNMLNRDVAQRTKFAETGLRTHTLFAGLDWEKVSRCDGPGPLESIMKLHPDFNAEMMRVQKYFLRRCFRFKIF